MATEGSGASRGGGEDFHNEDVFLVEEGLGLYVVCDGDGLMPGGELAARAASAALEDFIGRADEEIDLAGGSEAHAIVERAMLHALEAVSHAARSDLGHPLTTTTITMLLAQGDRGVIGHRGDSRAYLIRRSRSHQLTVDDELTHGAVSGTADAANFDIFSVELESGDTVVLCSDGAEEVVAAPEIARSAAAASPRLLASRIVSAAHQRNPAVDATAVVVRVRDARERGWLELSSPPARTAFGHTIERRS